MCSGLVLYINLPSLAVCQFRNETVAKVSYTKAYFTLKTQECQPNVSYTKAYFTLKNTGMSTYIITLHKMLKMRAECGTYYLPTAVLHIISDII
jgi:hypothetical protein